MVNLMSVLEGFPVFVKDVYISGNLDYSMSDVEYILGVFTEREKVVKVLGIC